MYDIIVDLLLFGGVDSAAAVDQEEKVTFICPVPGYDRHFSMLASFGIEMVTVDDARRRPGRRRRRGARQGRPERQGHLDRPDLRQPRPAPSCSQEVAARLAVDADRGARLPIFWDNAYAFHHLTEDEAKSADILSLCRRRRATRTGRSCSRRPRKITYAGAGVAVPRGVSARTCAWYLGHLAMGSIGPGQGQPAAARRSSSASPQGVRDHMRRHREIIAPKFAAVDAALTDRLDGLGVAEWTRPDRRLLRQPRRARRHRLTGRRAGQGGRHRADPGRGVVPATATTRATATSASRRRSRSSTRSRRPWPASPPASRSPRRSGSPT